MADNVNPASTPIHQANALVNQGKYDLAIAAFTTAIQSDAESSLAYMGRGVAYAKQKKYKQAIADYTAAIRLDPRLTPAYRNRGRDHTAHGDHKRALADFTDAIGLEPENADAYCDRATVYNRLGRYDLAIPDATEAIRLAPQMYLGHDARGYAYLGRANQRIFTFWRGGNSAIRKTEYRQAVADFTEALRLNPSALDCYVGRAQAYRGLGDTTNAAKDEECLRRNGLMR